MANKRKYLSTEKKLIFIIDKYIAKDFLGDYEVFTEKLYLIFVVYYLKYKVLNESNNKSYQNIDNILNMVGRVFRCLIDTDTTDLFNKKEIFEQLHILVDYIESDHVKTEAIYLKLQAQYERREILRQVVMSGKHYRKLR